MIRQRQSLPAPIRDIYEAVNRNKLASSNLAEFQGMWEAYIIQTRDQIQNIQIESEGEIVYLGRLSPGCQACKAGQWDCIFTQMKCNLRCEFCYSPLAIRTDYTGSVFGSTPEAITTNYHQTLITGISFSGGEPFLQKHKLIEWLAWFREHTPDKYTWTYTNGLLVDECSLNQLGQLGLNEIRFNTAATAYTHPKVLENLSLAAQFIPNVTVEIPAIPEHAQKLFAGLREWVERGVRYLNLHELIYEPGTISATMHGKRRTVILEDGHHFDINPDSRLLTLAVMKMVQDENLPVAVNDCSLQSKLRQLRGRRRSLAPLAKTPHEQFIGDDILESYCIYRDEQNYFFCHSDLVPNLRACHPDCRIMRITREAPLALNGKSRWISCEEC